MRPTVAGATEYGCCCERPRRDPGVGTHPPHYQPRQGLLHDPQRHQARSRQVLPVGRGRCDAPDVRPPGAPAALPQRRAWVQLLPEAHPRRCTRLAAHDNRANTEWNRVAGARDRGSGSPAVGRQPRLPWFPFVACTRRRPRTLRRAANRPRPRSRHELRNGARGCLRNEEAARRSRCDWLHQVLRQPRSACLCAPATNSRQCGRPQRCGRRGPRAGATAPRPHHRFMVEGGARRAHLHRLQPERTAQDGLRAMVGAGPRPRPGVVPVPVGDAAHAAAARHDHRHRAGLGRRARRCVGSDERLATTDRAVPRDGPPRPGGRAARRPVAARVPEDGG